MPDPYPRYEVSIAASEAERLLAYRLRHEVFIEEGGDHRYEQPGRLHQDRDDGPGSELLLARTGDGELVGTARLRLLRDGPFIGHELYAFDVLAREAGTPLDEVLPQVIRLDRVALLPGSRGQGLLARMQEFWDARARIRNFRIMVGLISVDNHRSRRAFARIGWREYPHVATGYGRTVQFIWRDLRT
jgi:GNAT superfamily N-acetyltransferase